MKVQMNLYVERQLKTTNKKVFKNLLKQFKPMAKVATIPVMATPILAYFTDNKKAEIRAKKILKEEANSDRYHTANTPVKDRTEYNEAALDKAGVKSSEYKKYIKSDGYMNDDGKALCRQEGVSFKGNADDAMELGLDGEIEGAPSIGAVDGFETANFDPLTFDNDIPAVESGLSELDLAEFEELSFSDIADVLENPALHAVAAELLPGTRFLQPVRDLRKGDFAKAGVGTLTRTAEIALAPIKLSWVAIGGVMGTALKVGGIDEEWTGPIGGIKHFSKEWAKGRDAIENGILGRETKEPELTPEQAYEQYKKAKEEAIKNLKEKIATRGEEYRKKLNEYYEKELLQRSEYNDYLRDLIEKENQREDFYIEQLTNIIATGQMDSEGINKDLQYLQSKKAELQKAYDEQVKQLDIYLQNNLTDEKIVQKVAQTKLELEKTFNSSSSVLNEEISRISNMLNVNNLLQQDKTNKGFKKIAGYEDVKDKLYTSLVRPLKLINSGENAEVPNLILLYGPKGCGKTMLSKSLVDETNSNYVKMRMTLNSDKDLENLQNVIKKSNENYKTTKKHTIIHIDEINGFLTDKKDLDFVSTIAKENHCTIVGTTNFPEKVNKNLIPEKGFESIYVGPADKRNLTKVLRYYLKNIVDSKFDYGKVADMFIENANGDFYSNARVENFIKNYIKTEFLKSNKFDVEVFSNSLKELTPDIKADSIKKF